MVGYLLPTQIPLKKKGSGQLFTIQLTFNLVHHLIEAIKEVKKQQKGSGMNGTSLSSKYMKNMEVLSL